MRARDTISLAALLALCAATAYADGGLVASRGTCVDGEPRQYLAVDGSTTTDCSTGSGAYDVACCCLNGSWAACASGGGGGSSSSTTLDRTTTAVTVTNSTTETTIYTYTIPGGTVDANGELRLTLLNEYLNNSGANRSLTIKVKLGGATVMEDTTGNIGASALNRIINLEVRVSALGATNSQKVALFGVIPAASGAVGTVTTGTGMATTIITSLNWSSGLTALTQDMTASAVLEVTVTHPSTTATQTWTTYAATLELLNP